jgi:hypothetical protein
VRAPALRLREVGCFTGGVLFGGIYNASIQDYNQFPDIFKQLSHALGRPPETIIADKGQSIDRLFELDGDAAWTALPLGAAKQQRRLETTRCSLRRSWHGFEQADGRHERPSKQPSATRRRS